MRSRAKAMKDRLIKKFDDEIAALDRELKLELPKEIKRARELGDLRENAEYAAAKERQRLVEARISMLQKRISEIHLLNVDRIPADRLMIETDAPYLLPRTIRPKPREHRNEPMYLRHICEEIARDRGEPVELTAANSTRVAERFFGLPAADVSRRARASGPAPGHRAGAVRSIRGSAAGWENPPPRSSGAPAGCAPRAG